MLVCGLCDSHHVPLVSFLLHGPVELGRWVSIKATLVQRRVLAEVLELG